MNDKKDDSEGKFNLGDDTASLLESLFKDTKSSQIKVVRRRIRPKSGVNKRAISKQRKDEGKEPSQTLSQKQGRPSPSNKSTVSTQSKILSRKKSLRSSIVPKDSRPEQSRQKSRHQSTAGAKPSPEFRRNGGKRIARPDVPKTEPPSSKISAGSSEERTESLDQSVLNSMISMVSGIKGIKKSPHHELSPEERQRLKTKKGGGEETSETDDLRSGPPVDIKGISGTDEEITEVMEKTTLESMISELEGSKRGGEDKASAKESLVSEEEEGSAEIFFDEDDLKTEPPVDIEKTTRADKKITEVLEKSALNSMISALEGSEKEGEDKTSAEESLVSDEEEGSAEIFFDEDDLKTWPPTDIEKTTGADEEITEILEKSALNSMISALEGSGKEEDDKASAEESSVSEEEETVVGIVVDSDDLKEEVPANTEGIDGATEEDSLSQEKPAAPSSIFIEDSLIEARTHEAYPESVPEEKPIQEDKKEVVEEAPQAIDLEEEQPSDFANAELTKEKALSEEKPVTEDRKEVVEEAPQAVDLEEEQPSDSANAELIEEKTLSQEKPAASTPILSKIPGTEADFFEVHHILEHTERSISEEKREDIERTSEVVSLEIEPLSDSSGPAKEEPRFQEISIPSFMSSEDSKVNTDEEEHHQPAAEEESVSKGEDILGKEESVDLEEGIALTEEELQLIRRSGHRSKVIRIGLPLILFGILVVILNIQYSPLDFFRREKAQKLMSDKSVEVSSPKKQGVTPKTLREKAPTTRPEIQPSTPVPAEKEIVRAPVPRKQDAAPETPKETVATVTPEVQPSTSEPPTILAMKESIDEASPIEQNTTPRTSQETFAATDQEVRLESPGPATPPPPSDVATKAEANQRKTSISHPYSVYLGSYSTLEGVEKAVLKYNENGLSSLYWQEVDLGDKGIWYRVFVGQFETKSEAEELIKERQLVDAEVRKTKMGVSIGSVSDKDVVPQAKAPEEQRLLTEAVAGSSYPYSVYIGSYKDLDRAQRAASDLQVKEPSYWVKTDLGEKGIWYRVYVGYFQTREQAEIFIKSHQIADGESRRTTYANLIGTYSSKEELDRMRLSLLNLEFSPYIIEVSGGRSHLFTGAFYQKARAEKEQLDLKAKGIESQLVER